MMRRSNLRQKARISYYEPEEPNLDEYVFCDKCSDYVFEYCSIHGPLLIIPDDKVPSKPKFPSFVPRAALTIPHVFLHLAPSIIPGAGIGVFSTLTLPRGVRFGPYRGLRSETVDSTYCWQIYDHNNKRSHVIDATDGARSNWMRYVNCARHWSEQNLVAYQYRGQLYYRTIKIIPRFTELMVFYGSEFANLLGVNLRHYNAPSGYAQKFGAPIAKKPKFTVPKNKNGDIRTNELKKNVEANTKTVNVVPAEVATNISTKKDVPVTTNSKVKIRKRKNQEKTSTERKKKSVKSKKFQATEVKHTKVVTKKTLASNIGAKVTKIPSVLHIGQNSNTLPRNDSEKIKLSNNNFIINNLKTEYTCDVCSYSFNNKNVLKAHINSHNVERRYKCNICQTSFNTMVVLKTHKRVHTGEKPYTCDICKKSFNRSGDLNTHTRTHTGEKPYTCDICKKSFNRLDHLNTHIRTHTGEKPYTCDICKKSFNQIGYLNIHIRTHTGEKPYTCDICKKSFTELGCLNRHIRTHTGKKPYTCDICKKSFNQSGYLNIHIRTHTGEKPYTCDICKKSFNQSGYLNIHIRTHTGKKPYTCDICKKSFNQSGYLNIHIRTHTGEKPYTCDICEMSFRYLKTLKSHILVHAGLDTHTK